MEKILIRDCFIFNRAAKRWRRFCIGIVLSSLEQPRDGEDLNRDCFILIRAARRWRRF